MDFKMWMPCRSELCNLTPIIHLYIILLPQTQSPVTLHGHSWPPLSSQVSQTHAEPFQGMLDKKTGPGVHISYMLIHVLPTMVFGEWSLCWTLSHSTNLSLHFLSPVHLQRGVTGALWWMPGVQLHYTYRDFFWYVIWLPNHIHYLRFALAISFLPSSHFKSSTATKTLQKSNGIDI